ncbi:MAG: hypothetical protein ACO1N1_26020 [Dyadobacter fermentans]
MKNLTTKILIVASIMVHSVAQAQFREGESFVSGSFYLNAFDSKAKNFDSHNKRYSHNIDVSVGKFKSSTFATGWGFNHGLVHQKLRNFNIDPKPIQSLSFGVNRFWEFYKPLNDKFALYARPSAGVTYAVKNEVEFNNNVIIRELHGNVFSLDLGVSAGIAWRVAPKWAIYGSFAFLSPINVSYGFGYSKQTANPLPDGQYAKSDSRAFSYRFAPDLSSGSIGLGFRYFYGMK